MQSLMQFSGLSDIQTDPDEIAIGQNAWSAACAYARSTAGQSSTALQCYD